MGRSHPVTRSLDKPSSQTSSGITEHIPGIFRAYSGHIPGISGHFRTRDGHRVPYRPSPDRVPSGSSRAVSLGAGHGVGNGCRMPYRRSPGTAWGRVIACRITSRRTRHEGRSSRAVSSVAGSRAVAPVAGSRIVTSLCVSATPVSLPCSRSGEPNARRLPCPGPTAACSRRRHRRFTNMYSFPWPWRFSMARSAARLRRIVGPLLNPKRPSGTRNRILNPLF